MKLLNLEIKGYKNLKEKVNFDFTQSNNYAALIGLNGSGKSNILEAVSIIFASLYTGRKIKNWNKDNEINYAIKYQLKNLEIQIIDGVITLLKENGIEKNKIVRKSKQDYLPSEIIACYSGDELRLWDNIYSHFYFSYLSKISKGYRSTKQNLVYLNKNSWELALLALLCHKSSHNYLKSLLKIEDLSTVSIRFHFADNYENRKDWFSKSVEAGLESSNEITELIQRIKDEQERTNEDLVYTQISSIELRVDRNNYKFCRKLFYLLFAAGMPKENKLFKKIEIKFNGFALKHLSEGEKKIILIKCLTDILANENTLILLDEPDSHVHIARKKEIKTLIDKPNYFTLLTTHSPSLLHHFTTENIFILNDKNEGDGVEVIESDKLKGLETISGGEFSLMDGVLTISSKKNILLVEGMTDEIHFKKALELFNNEYPELNYNVFETKSCSNLKQLLIGLAASKFVNDKVVIGIFDKDDEGNKSLRDNFKKVENEINIYRLTATTANTSKFYAIQLPIKENFNGNSFTVENLFSEEKYKEAYLQAVNEKKDYFANESISDISNDIETKAKKRLADASVRFGKDEFEGFRPILDLIKKTQEIL